MTYKFRLLLGATPGFDIGMQYTVSIVYYILFLAVLLQVVEGKGLKCLGAVLDV